MKRFTLDAWIALGLVALLIVIATVTALATDEEEPPDLASFSNTPGGARALMLWLDSIGFQTDGAADSVFRIPEGTGLVFMLEPYTGITEGEWQTIDAWVEQGGTLYLAGDGFGAARAFEHYDFSLDYGAEGETIPAGAPLLSSPPMTGTVVIKANTYLDTERDDYLVLLSAQEGPVLASIQQGAGQVILSTSPYIFSNAGLKEKGSPELILNLLRLTHPRQAGERGSAWFNEWHHGVRAASTGAAGPQEWLRYTPTGRALLFSVLVIFGALILQGRAFGRPLRQAGDISRRSPLEYVTALANLSRQAGHRTPVLRQYSTSLKRHLARRYGLDPGLPNADYVSQLAAMKPELEASSLLRLLTRLQSTKVSENELIQLAQEVSDWQSVSLRDWQSESLSETLAEPLRELLGDGPEEAGR